MDCHGSSHGCWCSLVAVVRVSTTFSTTKHNNLEFTWMNQLSNQAETALHSILTTQWACSATMYYDLQHSAWLLLVQYQLTCILGINSKGVGEAVHLISLAWMFAAEHLALFCVRSRKVFCLSHTCGKFRWEGNILFPVGRMVKQIKIKILEGRFDQRTHWSCIIHLNVTDM